MNKLILFVIILLNTLGYAEAQKLTLKWKTDSLLRTPESVYYDGKANILYVSNIDGKSGEKDGNGFITKLRLDGKIETLQWVTGLDAPKGMGLVKGKLYVADLSKVAVIDIATGRIDNSIEIEGAQFLNDITVDKKGNVYVSDSATGKIHLIKGDDKAELYFESKAFTRINGLLAIDDMLYVADAGNGANYKLSKNKELNKFTETSQGADGILLVGKDEYIVSSWPGEVYYVNAEGKAQKLLDTKEQKLNSADLGYHPATKTVFVPTFNGNTVMAYEWSK
ncbi:SMP-30/gluconolactonase/LRE family protein [Chryseosolibacter indicus]|nr:ATP/GTP-binding protein [Chryseosolibacter indicus]